MFIRVQVMVRMIQWFVSSSICMVVSMFVSVVMQCGCLGFFFRYCVENVVMMVFSSCIRIFMYKFIGDVLSQFVRFRWLMLVMVVIVVYIEFVRVVLDRISIQCYNVVIEFLWYSVSVMVVSMSMFGVYVLVWDKM